MVANVDRSYLQNVAGIMESREPFAKHHPDFARSGLASEMDRLAADCNWNFHFVLRSRFPQTDNRRATDHAIGFDAGKAKAEGIGAYYALKNYENNGLPYCRRPFFFLRIASGGKERAKTAAAIAKWGYFSGPIVRAWEADGRT